MKPVYILRHIECEGPGYLEKVLYRKDIPFQLIAIDEDDPVPASPQSCSGLVLMGGPMSANDDDEWIKQEITLIQNAIEHRLPVLGHCLGGQLIAKALGATIKNNPVREIDWYPVYRADPHATPGWLTHFRIPQNVFHWHEETFELPEGAQHLLSSDHCLNQAFQYEDNVLAFQCHIEMTDDMVGELSQLYSDQLKEPPDTVQSHHDMLADVEYYMANMHKLADEIYNDWLSKLETN